MKIKENILSYFHKKSKLGLLSDFLFIAILLAMVFPQSRMWLISNVNKAKIFFVQPSVIEADKAVSLSADDYQLLFTDLNNNNLDFSLLKGKVIFLNFWATWCPPCVAEMPSIQKLYNAYRNNNQIAFILLTNEEKTKVKTFLQKQGYDFPVFFNQDRIPEVLSTNSIPTTFLISKSGKLVIKEIGASDWAGNRVKTEIEKLLKEE
ncbi:MAG: TlpA disulfide reductase family protein [Bacteroidales bacterium]